MSTITPAPDPTPNISDIESYISLDAFLAKITAYMPDADVALISKAYRFIEVAHAGVMRDSGDPYVSHPIAVAEIMIDEQVDQATLIAGLLHDVVEDTDHSDDDIKRDFGEDVALLVDGVTKLTKLEAEESQFTKDEANLHKLASFIIKDLRVLIIKAADRLHNMRTLGHKKGEEKRKKKAQETFVFANLADFAGLTKWKEELQDLGFKQLNPEAYETIHKALSNAHAQSGELLGLISDKIHDQLAQEGIKSQVTGRVKAPYSTYLKLNAQKITLSKLSDVIAFRVITDDEDACYHALGILHRQHSSVDDEFNDYISTPKKNGYSSLHTVIYFKASKQWDKAGLFSNLSHFNPASGESEAVTQEAKANLKTIVQELGIRIEVQIRSKKMHEHAEKGDAAHWLYKSRAANGGKSTSDIAKQNHGRSSFLQRLLDSLILAHTDDDDISEAIEEATSQNQIYIISPKGKVFFVKKGSTPLDYAFHVHSNFGFYAVGAKINGRRVPLKTRIFESGRQVEIIRAETQQLNETWTSWVYSSRGRKRVKEGLAALRRKHMVEQGRFALQRYFDQQGYPMNVNVLDKVAEQLITLPKDHPNGDHIEQKTDELFYRVAHWIEAMNDGILPESLADTKDTLSMKDVLTAAYPGANMQHPPALNSASIHLSTQIKKRIALDVGKTVQDKNAAIYHFAGCCCPLPGERIIGFMPTDSQVTIHRTDCLSLERLEGLKQRWIDAQWEKDADQNARYKVKLRMTLLNQPGVLHEITGLTTKEGCNIANLKFRERFKDLYVMDLELEVSNARHYHRVQSALILLENVDQIQRF
ncbi:MAG: bifunctional (p)ppGpp synthetase/guanosine-3',5'-bis(diphosphate) 3'-pyrophosphohydrolase [Alphaproteobacteria bacterium]